MLCCVSACLFLDLLSRKAKPSLPFTVIGNGALQVLFCKVRPEGAGDVQLGIRGLPEKKIADPVFAAGSDEQIGIGQSGGIEMIGKQSFVNQRGINASRRNPPADILNRL
jgi:hypothetical protein